MLSDTPVTTAISFGPVFVVTRLTTSVGNMECISRGTLSVLTFHRSFMLLTFAIESVLSSFCHAVRCGLPPSVNQSALTATSDPTNNATTTLTSLRISISPVVLRRRCETRSAHYPRAGVTGFLDSREPWDCHRC